MLTPVFNPASLGLTSGRVVGFNGTTFANTLAAYAGSGDLFKVTAGANADVCVIAQRFSSGSTGNLFSSRDENGNVMARVTAAGFFSRPGSGASSEYFGAVGTLGSGANNTVLGAGATDPGSGANNTILGSLASGFSGASNSVAVGKGAVISNAESGSIAIGYLASAGNRSLAIGYQASATCSNPAIPGLAVGRSAVATEGFALGTSASCSSARGMALGDSASVSGLSGNNTAIALGFATACTTNNQFRIGQSSASTTCINEMSLVSNTTFTFTSNLKATDNGNERTARTTITSWATGTDATRKARTTFNVYDTVAREAFRIEASGSAAMIGFLGASAVARQTITGSRGGNVALASLLTALATAGLITDSTSA